jgi:hypothetical protein
VVTTINDKGVIMLKLKSPYHRVRYSGDH